MAKYIFLLLLILVTSCTPWSVPAAVTTETVTAVTTETVIPSPTSTVICAIVTADTALNLREAPGIQGRVIVTLLHGAQVTVIDQAVTWWKVRTAEGLEGWSHSDFLNQSICKQENKP